VKFDNFLTDVYFGSLDKKIFDNFQDLRIDKRSRDFIDKYLDVSKEHPPLDLEKQGVLSQALLEKLQRIHFFGLSIPEAYGGVGLSLVQYLTVVEAIAPNSLSLGFTALAHLSIGIKGIVLFGNEEQKRKYLVPAAAGKMIFCYALTEPKTGSDAQHIETAATLSEDGRFYILNGQKTYITNANYAGAMTVFAQLDPLRPGFMGAFIVETSWDGVVIGEEMPKMGLKASSTAAVQFKDVQIPVGNLLGQPGDGFKIAMVILNYGRLALGAASSGMMKRSLKDMEKRAAGRKQFGAPINQFELIQEKIVRAKVNSSITAAITALTAGMLEKNPLAPVPVESSHCKLFGTTRAWDTLYDALQVAGGSGYLLTQPYENRLRDFRVTTIFEGTTEIHSIYPALFMMRKLSKHMKTAASGKISQIAVLIKALFQKADWSHRFAHKEMRQAERVARSMARSIRFLIISGLLLYGQKVLQKQFFLRRITSLSFYFYGILAMLARTNSAVKAGRPVAEDLEVIAYFASEARQYQRQNRHLLPSKTELLHKRVYRDIAARFSKHR